MSVSKKIRYCRQLGVSIWWHTKNRYAVTFYQNMSCAEHFGWWPRKIYTLRIFFFIVYMMTLQTA